MVNFKNVITGHIDFKTPNLEDRVNKVESLLDSHVHDGRETRNIIQNSPIITSGVAAPTTTPKKVGDMFIDTVANKMYVATGTVSSSDWTILN